MLLSTGFASALLAPFGAHAVNLAAITAAICTNAEALPDKAQRWKVGVIYALFYLALAATAPLLVRLFLAMGGDGRDVAVPGDGEVARV